MIASGAVEANAAEQKAKLSPHLRECYAAYKSATSARNFGEAHRYARRCLELAERELPPNDPNAATLAYNVGAVSLKLERYRDAAAQLEHAVERYRAAYGEYAEETVSPLRRLGKAYVALEQWPLAERAWTRAIEILERNHGRDDPQIAPILFDLVPVAERMKQHKRVKAYGRRAINLYAKGPKSKGDDETQIEIGLLHLALARNELELGDFSTSKKHMAAAMDTLEPVLPLGHPHLIALYRFMSEAYAAAGVGSRAHKYKKKLEENEEAAARRG